MTIKRTIFPNTLLIIANSKYLFGSIKSMDDALKVVYKFSIENIADIYLTGIGLIGFEFKDSGEFASVESLKFNGSGTVPQEVTDNEEIIDRLQEARITFMNFIVALLFGRINSCKNITLTGAIFSGQDKITAFRVMNGFIWYQPTEYLSSEIVKKMPFITQGKNTHNVISLEEIENASSFILKLWQRKSDFKYADIQACMTMNYQAAILHNQQNAAASFALNFSVIECLIREIFYMHGLIKGISSKIPININHAISKKDFEKFKLNKLLEILCKSGLINGYLYNSLSTARIKRNELMHAGKRISSKESGDCQTFVRDLWALLIETPFELNAGWSYKR